MTETTTRGVAVVTGASSGIGAACVRQLAAAGFQVAAAARRGDRLEALAAEVGAAVTPITCDVTSDTDVADLVEGVRGIGGPVTLLVNNAGGARGLDDIGEANIDDWRWMYDVNVLGTVRVTKALLPDLDASGAGTVVVMSSTAGLIVYEGGGGYAAAKHGQTALAETLRLELSGRPIRVVEIDPGMVRTEEFGLNRFQGDPDKAVAAYAGVAKPLVAEDVAECVTWTATLPHHINVDRLVVRPLAQAAQHKVHRVFS